MATKLGSLDAPVRTVAVINKGSRSPVQLAPGTTLWNISLGSRDIHFGLVDMPKPQLDWDHELLSHAVLIRVEALSCNFRDRSYVALLHDQLKNNPDVPAAHFGSDFVGTIVETGPQATLFSTGQRVIPNMQYEGTERGGIPTNRASQGWLVLPQHSLRELPENWSTAEGAATSLGVQTAHSMIRRAAPQRGSKVLVCSGRSSTSQFLIQLLRRKGINVDVLTTSTWNEEEIASLNSTGNAGSNESLAHSRGTAELLDIPLEAVNPASYDVVFDPFADLHLEGSLQALKPLGTYVTCGFARQYHQAEKMPELKINSLNLIQTIISKNLTIIGNCLGKESDLIEGVSLLREGSTVPLGSQWELSEVRQFLDLSFGQENASFGKNVLLYSSN